MASANTERREFFRINDKLRIDFRKMTREEYLLFQQHLKEGEAFPRNLTEIYGKTSKKPQDEEFYACLQLIDRKLDAVLDLLSGTSGDFYARHLDVNISGSGIRHYSDVKLQEGAYMELRVLLPVPPNPRIAVAAKVLRSKHRLIGGEEVWDTALTFSAIRERDRDFLISYIFNKEREDLRIKHNL
jgi:hypothetical protein